MTSGPSGREASVEILRHAPVDFYGGDPPLSAGADRAIREWLAARETQAEPGVTTWIVSSLARRCQETARCIHAGLSGQGLVLPVAWSQGLSDIAVNPEGMGLRLGAVVRNVETARLLGTAHGFEGLEDYVAGLAASADSMGFWLAQPAPYIETPAATVERLVRFVDAGLSLDAPDVAILGVSHSGPMRAFLRWVFGCDFPELACLQSFVVGSEADGGWRVRFLEREGVVSREQIDAVYVDEMSLPGDETFRTIVVGGKA